MAKKRDTEIAVTPSSGNVFADLGFEEPEKELAEAKLASRIRQIAKRCKKLGANPMRVEIQREEDGCWIGEVPALPGVLAYGATKEEAQGNVEALAFRILADKMEHGEPVPDEARKLFDP